MNYQVISPKCSEKGCLNNAHPKNPDSDCWDCDGKYACNAGCLNPRHWNLCEECFEEDQDYEDGREVIVDNDTNEEDEKKQKIIIKK